MSEDMILYEEQDLLVKLTRDMKNAASTLKKPEVRFLVEAYYRMQEQRNQVRTSDAYHERFGEPNTLLDWMYKQAQTLEKQVAGALDAYSMSNSVGEWLRSIPGVGPVITAGLMAHLDIAPWRCNNVALKGKKNLLYCGKGRLHRHVRARTDSIRRTMAHLRGSNPRIVWEKKTRRPWNLPQTLCFKLGESFVELQNHKDDFYGTVFVERKDEEWKNNYEGGNEKAAELALKKNTGHQRIQVVHGSNRPTLGRRKFGRAVHRSLRLFRRKPSSERRGTRCYRLHIHARARRYTVLFLYHLLKLMWLAEQGEMHSTANVLRERRGAPSPGSSVPKLTATTRLTALSVERNKSPYIKRDERSYEPNHTVLNYKKDEWFTDENDWKANHS